MNILKNNSLRRGRPRKRPENCFGGDHFKTYNPSQQRPIFSQKALHLVLRSSQTKGKRSFLNKAHEDFIWKIIKKHAQKNAVTIYEFANAGNHIHLLIRVKRRDFYCRFIRSITGLIARQVGRSEKGQPLSQKFWDARPFSRVVSFSRSDFQKVRLYIKRNIWEAIGFIPHIKRSKKLTPEWKLFWENLVTVPT